MGGREGSPPHASRQAVLTNQRQGWAHVTCWPLTCFTYCSHVYKNKNKTNPSLFFFSLSLTYEEGPVTSLCHRRMHITWQPPPMEYHHSFPKFNKKKKNQLPLTFFLRLFYSIFLYAFTYQKNIIKSYNIFTIFIF